MPVTHRPLATVIGGLSMAAEQGSHLCFDGLR
jgi:hypothetical protein